MHKDTAEHPDWRDAAGKVCGEGVQRLHALSWHVTLPAPPCLQPRNSRNLTQTLEMLMEASSQKHKQSLTPFPVPLPVLENERWG